MLSVPGAGLGTGELGSVGGPVCADAAGPAHRRERAQPEDLGQHGGGQAGRKVAERGATRWCRLDAEAAQPLAELVGAEGRPWAEAGEKPCGVRW